jgi:hypothetical protein
MRTPFVTHSTCTCQIHTCTGSSTISHNSHTHFPTSTQRSLASLTLTLTRTAARTHAPPVGKGPWLSEAVCGEKLVCTPSGDNEPDAASVDVDVPDDADTHAVEDCEVEWDEDGEKGENVDAAT